MPGQAVTAHPLTPDRWGDFERLMGPKGGYGGCWCMLWRLGKASYDERRGEANRLAMSEQVRLGTPPGAIAYLGEEPVGWVSVAPRATFVRLASSRVLRPVDDRPVWSISCLYVHRHHRRRGITHVLIEAAIDLARAQRAEALEGYPVLPAEGNYPVSYAWTGFHANFIRAGFVEVARRSPTRPIMRYELAEQT